MKYDRQERDYQRDIEQKDDRLERSLAPGEKVLWSGKPKRSAFLLNKCLTMLPLALVWLAIDGALLYMIFGVAAKDGGLPPAIYGFLIPFFVLHLAPVWVWLAGVLTAGRRQKNTIYALTDRRVIFMTGFVSTQFDSLQYGEIVCVDLRVGVVDRMCKVGDVYFRTSGGGRKSHVFFDIADCAAVQALAQKTVTDMRADMAFPNALRPGINPGYETAYAPSAPAAAPAAPDTGLWCVVLERCGTAAAEAAIAAELGLGPEAAAALARSVEAGGPMRILSRVSQLRAETFASRLVAAGALARVESDV